MYTLKFVDSETFDKLPYKNVGTSVGVADRNKGVAYVRDTANPMDVFTAFHELEHLKGDDLGEHESPGEDGVYYKDTGGWLQTLGPILSPFTGPAAPFVVAGSQIGGHALSASNQAKQERSQQNSMSQFQQPQMAGQPATIQQAPQPNVVQAGGAQAGGSPQGGPGGAVGKIRNDQELTRQFLDQKGYYAGRQPGGM